MKKAQIPAGTMVKLKASGPVAPLYEVAFNLDDNTVSVLTPSGNVYDFLKEELLIVKNEKKYKNSSKFFAQNLEFLYKDYMKTEDFEKIVKNLSSDFMDSYLEEIATCVCVDIFGTAKCVMMGTFQSLSKQHQWIKRSERWGKLLRKALKTVSIFRENEKGTANE